MISIEKEVNGRFSEFFTSGDWHRFKAVSESYFQRAVYYKKADVKYVPVTNGKDVALLARNIQKRLDIGIGVELLIKSYYLKSGYIINLVKDKKSKMKNFPFKQSDGFDGFYMDKTFTLNDMIQNIKKVKEFTNFQVIDAGFRIAKVFRNKEGHVVTRRHFYKSGDYSTIESALKYFYSEAFNQNLDIQFSIEGGENGVWNIST